MTTKTMMQLAWDNWHGDIDPSDIPGIKRGFQEGWERCAELHAGIDIDKINADLIGYREQIARLRVAIEAATKERDALKDAARLALDALYAYEPCIKKFGLLFGTGNKAIAALKAAL